MVHQAHEVQELHARCTLELVPEILGLGDQVQVIALGVGHVEIAGRAVGGADVMPLFKLLQEDNGPAAAGKLPRGSGSHRPSADHDDVNFHHSSTRLDPAASPRGLLPGPILPD
ncbi:hypothetical protein D9M72_456980 [compost metagenome]